MSSTGVQAIGPLIEGNVSPVLVELKFQERINDDSVMGNRGQRKGQASKSERLYAIKSNCNQLLDLARDTYQENVSDIMECELSHMQYVALTKQWPRTWKVCFLPSVNTI